MNRLVKSDKGKELSGHVIHIATVLFATFDRTNFFFHVEKRDFSSRVMWLTMISLFDAIIDFFKIFLIFLIVKYFLKKWKTKLACWKV